MEAAVMAGLVTDLTGVEDFWRTRLRTSARVAAAFAAAACHGAERAGFPALAAELDAEFEARTPSEAARTASRRLGGIGPVGDGAGRGRGPRGAADPDCLNWLTLIVSFY
jgi:urease accessory protein UreF